MGAAPAPEANLSAEASLARGEATRHFPDALYPSKHICRLNRALPQQIACPWGGHAMPGDFVAVNRLGQKRDVRFGPAQWKS